jgi:hypothetical protein
MINEKVLQSRRRLRQLRLLDSGLLLGGYKERGRTQRGVFLVVPLRLSCL